MMHCLTFDFECPYCEQDAHIIMTSGDEESMQINFCPFCGSELSMSDVTGDDVLDDEDDE